MHLTDLAIKSFPLTGQGQKDYADDAVRWLTVRVGKSRKTFMLLIRNGSSRTRVKLDTYPDLSLSKARELARAKLAEAHAPSESSRLTFGDAMEAYFRIHGPKLRPVTRKEWGRLFEAYFRIPLSKHAMGSIKTVHLATILDAISRAPTRRCACVALRMFFNWHYRRGYIDTNPVI